MKIVWLLALVAVVYCSEKYAPPKVQVYTTAPGKHGRENVLVCFVSGFHPPDVTIVLIKNGREIVEARQTDLAFKHNWQFHLTKSMPFTPAKEDAYSCRVTHGVSMKDYAWVPNM
nr:beta-2-microglobulin-1 [Ogcocephalus cubifrons]